MVSFDSIVKDIKNIKIKGATNVAIAATKALGVVTNENKDRKATLIGQINYSKQILFKTRPSEPVMRNAINYLTFNIDSYEEPVLELKKRQEFIKKHFEEASERISFIGAKKVKNVVFTHNYSSLVVEILKKAKKEGKRFKLYNTESRPLFNGRLTAREVARVGIPVKHFVDSAGRLALKEADVMLIGADAISSEGKVYCKIGSEMFAEIADKYDVSVYVCSDSWKFDPQSVFGYEEVEKKYSNEIWPAAPNGISIERCAFEKVNPDLISGVISELGVYKPEVFIEEVKRAYPWMF